MSADTAPTSATKVEPGAADAVTALPVDEAPKPKRSRSGSRSRSTSTRSRTRKKDTTPRSSRASTPRAPKAKSVGDKATEQLAVIGTMCRPFVPRDSDVLLRGASPFGQSLDALCAEYPSVQKVAEMLLGNSAVMGFAMTLAAIALPIAANHGVVPPKIGETADSLLAFLCGDVSAAQLAKGGAFGGVSGNAADVLDPELARLAGLDVPAETDAAAA